MCVNDYMCVAGTSEGSNFSPPHRSECVCTSGVMYETLVRIICEQEEPLKPDLFKMNKRQRIKLKVSLIFSFLVLFDSFLGFFSGKRHLNSPNRFKGYPLHLYCWCAPESDHFY